MIKRSVKMEKWAAISIEDKETILSFDPKANMLNVYTSDQTVAYRILKMIGKPTHTDYIYDLICSMTWNISYAEREKIKRLCSVQLLTNVQNNSSHS